VKKAFISCLILSFAGIPVAGQEMTQSVSSHFILLHEDRLVSVGFLMQLEQIHSRLDFDLGMFWPVEKGRIKVYLFKSKESYLASSFQPPEWSNGLAIPVERTVLLYPLEDEKTLLRVASHEMTHVLFESYWDDKGDHRPPAWLNEGLAMFEETRTDRSVDSYWHDQLPALAQLKKLSLKSIVETTPIKDLAGEQSVGTWYIEAYSLVFFLLNNHPRLEFRSFCESFRQSGNLEKSLWTAYGYSSLKLFSQDWKKWLGHASGSQNSWAQDSMAKPLAPLTPLKPESSP
jgi:hypothetical protein